MKRRQIYLRAARKTLQYAFLKIREGTQPLYMSESTSDSDNLWLKFKRLENTLLDIKEVFDFASGYDG